MPRRLERFTAEITFGETGTNDFVLAELELSVQGDGYWIAELHGWAHAVGDVSVRAIDGPHAGWIGMGMVTQSTDSNHWYIQGSGYPESEDG